MFFTIQNTPSDWAYHAEKSEDFCLSSSNGSFWPRGKTLGGSGAINAMLYVRGNRRDYDRWSDLGNTGWGYEEVLEYFKKSEDNLDAEIANAFDGKYHGTGGYLKVQRFPTDNYMIDVVLKGAQQIGYEELQDVNADKNIGFGKLQGTIANGARCSPAKAFLVPIKDRPNLHVMKHTRVINLEKDKSGKFSTANIYMQEKHLRSVKANKEIILSAGSIGTPQILMLSGIGPQAVLKSIGLEVVAELPVGKNLQDHPIVPVLVKLNKSTAKNYNSYEELVKNMNQYLLARKGSFAAHGVTSASGFVNTVNATDLYPDIQYHFFEFNKASDKWILFTKQVGYNEEVSHSFRKASEEADVLMVVITLLNPFSKGSLEVTTQEWLPYRAPKILANYLEDKRDVETFIRAVRLLQKLIASEEFRRNEAEIHRMDVSGCTEI
ncbi:glucose dehydrogenase [FAD, quinone]-like, partial [Uranotaenia lowii]|uniref:glucose dehydrogenase [FAD, quinone]-like n=1 Tax=Uranotaenia lowii TaxID=190385 RepID=UPI00247945FF